MKGVDTPLLLALLEGKPGAEVLTQAEGDQELCTTEVNLLELEVLARSGAKEGRARRLASLDRLRHRMGVLPVDERASRAGALLASQNSVALPAATWLVLGALHAAGATELLTTEASGLSAVKVPFRITSVRRRHPKGR
ncbi:MAG TPA: type II toxin-antitoxin system VapC family toxin [Thermoplasmata archaeon]|nr:type II toxin-antitoxin system VapC family toxin [Thermoplasmata archaeon]